MEKKQRKAQISDLKNSTGAGINGQLAVHAVYIGSAGSSQCLRWLHSHIFLGFTRDGLYMLSYTMDFIQALDFDPLAGARYSMHFWRFQVDGAPMTRVLCVPLFGQRETAQELLLHVVQREDDTIVVFGVPYVRHTFFNPRMLFSCLFFIYLFPFSHIFFCSLLVFFHHFLFSFSSSSFFWLPCSYHLRLICL